MSTENSQVFEKSKSVERALSQQAYNRRVEMINSRDELFFTETNALSNFLRNEPEITEIVNSTEIKYKYPLTASQTFYSTICGHNIPGYSYCYPAKLKSKEKGIQWIIAKEVQIKNFKIFPSQFLQAYSLLKYFANIKKLFCQRIFDIFRIRTKNVFVFFLTIPIEHQSIRCALLNGRIVMNVKQIDDDSILFDNIFQQILSATEQLNICGVAHRFITIDNVFYTLEKTIQFGSFDFATTFWNPIDNVRILSPKGLGISITNFEYYEHLPPEAFTPTGYDTSMVDIWSIAIMICRILIGSTPFENLTRSQIFDPNRYVKHWKESDYRTMIPDSYRIIVDEIFRPMKERMTIFDLLNDPFWLKKATKRLYPYYRIDIREGINSDGPPKFTELDSLEFNYMSTISHTFPKVSDEVKKAFHTKDQFKFVEKFDNIQNEYSIDISGSFTNEFKLLSDLYFKAIKNKTGQACVMRVFCHSFPNRYRKLLTCESCKIAKLCLSSSYKAVFHEIYDVFISPNSKNLWIFYENIIGYRPLSLMISQQGETLIVRHLVHWFNNLIKALQAIADIGAAHRYVRAEYVIIHPDSYLLKLTHPDMAGFAINPELEKLSPRSSGMQDENESMWNHVPPETFESRYDIMTFDVWSMGVIICFCMTRGKYPFTIEQLKSNWMSQWIRFRNRYILHLETIPDLCDLLNRIFLDCEQRISVFSLDKHLKDITKNNSKKQSEYDGKGKKYNSNNKLQSKSKSKINLNIRLHSPKNRKN